VDTARTDELIQFALAVAAEADERFDRRLRPIHLIKYVYLGDLAHAAKNRGKTFTGARWRFYHFGPFAAEVFNRVEPAAAAIGANSEILESKKYDKDSVCYWLEDEIEHLLRQAEKKLPLEVASAVRRAVKLYGNDTNSLLRHVYVTAPVLRASPNEYLEFGSAVSEIREATKPDPAAPPPRKRSRSERERIRQEVHRRLDARNQRTSLKTPDPAPRYDEVFAEGVRWLDSLGGEPIGDLSAEAVISDDVWKDPSRSGPEVP